MGSMRFYSIVFWISYFQLNWAGEFIVLKYMCVSDGIDLVSSRVVLERTPVAENTWKYRLGW